MMTIDVVDMTPRPGPIQRGLGALGWGVAFFIVLSGLQKVLPHQGQPPEGVRFKVMRRFANR
jgi:hypothetical protein